MTYFIYTNVQHLPNFKWKSKVHLQLNLPCLMSYDCHIEIAVTLFAVSLKSLLCMKPAKTQMESQFPLYFNFRCLAHKPVNQCWGWEYTMGSVCIWQHNCLFSTFSFWASTARRSEMWWTVIEVTSKYKTHPKVYSHSQQGNSI